PVLRHIRRLSGAFRSQEQSDRELLFAFIAQKSEEAFSAIVRRHGPMILAVCRRVHAEDAEDALQATFLHLARRARSLENVKSLAGWLHGVAYRMAMNGRRSALRRRRYERSVAPVPPQSPAWQAAWREVQVLLDEEIGRLPEKNRAPFVLCYLENKSCAEIG